MKKTGMGRLSGFKYRIITRKLKALGFMYERPGHGSHEIWVNNETRRLVTIPHHPGDIPEGTLRAILRQAGIDVESFLNAKEVMDCNAFPLSRRLFTSWPSFSSGEATPQPQARSGARQKKFRGAAGERSGFRRAGICSSSTGERPSAR